MQSFFYNRTMYRFMDIQVPDFFIDLDKFFDKYFVDPNEIFSSEGRSFAENTCRRMAAIDMFAENISSTIETEDPFKAAILCSSLLVAYLSSCKSLLDTCAITLAKIYELPLTNKQMDFSKGKFWNELEAANKSTHDKYQTYRPLFGEVIKWRDAAIHRISPLILVHSPGKPSEVNREDKKVRMVSRPDVDQLYVIRNINDLDWVDPLSLHHKWRDQFLDLCELLCGSIRMFFESNKDSA